ncbi:MAG: xanthine dehydrogenase family protein subunit M [Thermomicrobiales bacterium]|nr:xanthine dehydrogenase family protein subunit M [Thermomicrobiales bacterium]
MIPGPFEYHAPTSLDEAIGLLGQYGDDAKVLAGGQSLIPAMKLRLAQPGHLIDISRMPDLAGLTNSFDGLRIGALTRETALETSADVRERYAMLHDAAGVIADPLVRNLATVGGNIAHADPANDHPAVMLAYRAEVEAQGPNGSRTIPIDDFFLGAFETALAPDEILTAIRIPAPPAQSGGAYVKFERKVGDYAIAAAAVQLALNADGTIASAGLALTNAGYTPIRSSRAEAALVGQAASDEAFKRAADLAAEDADPTADLRGDADYKRAMARTMTLRALRIAAQRASGQAGLNGVNG